MEICALLLCFGQAIPALGQSPPSLLAGTPLWARPAKTVSSKTARIGDQVEAITIRPVKQHGKVVLPADTRLRGAVEAVRTADRSRKIPPRLRLVFTEMILPDGRTVSTKVSVEYPRFRREIRPSSYFGFVAAGATVGAGIGAAWGGKGAEIGAVIGAGTGLLDLLWFARTRWHDIKIRDYRDLMLLNLDDDLMLPPTTPPSKP